MLTYDFHIHSALSPCGDADMTPNNIVNMASLLGLGAIAISDHNTVGNVRAAMKVGEKVGVKVIPGMEVETMEEIHILTLFPTIEQAEEVARAVYDALPPIKNRPEIFGEQRFLDEEDQIVGYEDKLLISPTSLSVEDLYQLVERAGGIFIPAHVDRHSYSILTNLGFIPEDLGVRVIEVSKKIDSLEDYLGARPDLTPYKVVRNSDAHYLEDMMGHHAEIENLEEIFSLRRL